MTIRMTPGAVLMLAVLAAGRSVLLPATLLAAAFHEAGHLAAAKLLDIRLRLLELDTFGAKLYPVGTLPSYRAEGLLAAAGPAASLLLWVLTLPIGGVFADCLRLSTLSFALFNLMPISGFDGGRVLGALVAAIWGAPTAERVLEISSYLALLFLFSLSACMLLCYGQQLALGVLSASLFAQVFLPKRRKA